MNDMSVAIVPKVDQVTADHLIAGPLTIVITGVSIKAGAEQPVEISYDGGDGLPWRPCKSMSRVLVAAWGPDAKVYVGRSITLYRDPKVKWGGMEVGGIRISHMSHLNGSMTMALTATKGSKKPFTVQPLVNAPRQPEPERAQPTDDELLARIRAALVKAETLETWTQITSHPQAKRLKEQLAAEIQTAYDRLNTAAAHEPVENYEWPGAEPETQEAA